MQILNKISLPPFSYNSQLSVENAILKRRSRRSYAKGELTLHEVSQLLFVSSGITGKSGHKRAAPSAGATYPIAVYLVAGNVEGLEKGIYHYIPKHHAIVLVKKGDVRKKLTAAALMQIYILKAPASIILAADYKRTMRIYGQRGRRYVHIEIGHIGENIYLECESLGLSTVTIGAFSDSLVKKALGISEEPLYVMPIGRRK